MDLIRRFAEARLSSPVWGPIIRTGGMGTINRGATILVRLVTIPLVVNYLGAERFGFVMMIASVAGYIMLLDFGLSSALVNRLTHCYTENNVEGANLYITSGVSFLAALSIVSGIIALFTTPLIDWVSLLKLSSVTNHEATVAISMAIVVFLAQLPLSVILKIPYTRQRGMLSEACLLIGTLVCFAGVLVCTQLSCSLANVLVFMIGSPTIGSLILLVRLLQREEIAFAVHRATKLRALMLDIRRDGYHFFVMQAVGLLMNTLQFTLLALYHGVEAVAVFSLLTQATMAMQVPYLSLIQPIWTKVAELTRRGQSEGIRSILAGYLVVAVIYGLLASMGILFLLDPILSLVLIVPMALPMDLLIGFAALTTLGLVFGGGIGAVILGMDLTRQMALIVLGQFVLFLVASFLLVPTFAALGSVLSVCVGYLVAAPGSVWVIRKRLLVMSESPT